MNKLDHAIDYANLIAKDRKKTPHSYFKSSFYAKLMVLASEHLLKGTKNAELLDTLMFNVIYSDTVTDVEYATLRAENSISVIQCKSDTVKYIETIMECEKQEDITAFLCQLFDTKECAVYVNEENKDTVIATTTLNYSADRVISGLIERLAPWIFEENDVIRELSRAAFKGQLDEFSNCFDRNIDIDFESIVNKENLKAFEGKISNIASGGIRRNIRTHERDLESYIQRVTQLRRDLKREKIQLDTAMMNDDFGVGVFKNLVEYVKLNNNISIDYSQISNDSNSLYFVFRSKLEEFSEREAKSHINNQRSYFYNNIYRFEANGERKRFLEAVFLERKLKIYTYCYYRVTFNTDGYTTINVVNDMDKDRYDEAMYHPHIMRYSCTGQNLDKAVTLMNGGKVVESLEQLNQSSKNFEVTDVPVGEAFIDYIHKTNCGFIEAEDVDHLMTYEEAINYLKEKDESEVE